MMIGTTDEVDEDDDEGEHFGRVSEGTFSVGCQKQYP